MTKNDFEKLANEIISLAKKLFNETPIKQEIRRPVTDWPDDKYSSVEYSWGVPNDELKHIQAEAIQKYQRFYSAALKYIKKHLPERERDFVEDEYGNMYSTTLLKYLRLHLYCPREAERAACIHDFCLRFSHQKDILLSIEIDDNREFNAISREQDVLKIIEQVCNRFHRFALQLRKTPRKDQSQLSIRNEYDVQYLLRAILSLYFDDIRPEEPGGSSAGSSSKADFWLDDEKVVIETKYRGSTLADKKLKADLNTDIGDYQKIANCQTIVFFIYDPENRIENPDGFEKDFNNRTHEKLTIKTFIRPKP